MNYEVIYRSFWLAVLGAEKQVNKMSWFLVSPCGTIVNISDTIHSKLKIKISYNI